MCYVNKRAQCDPDVRCTYTAEGKRYFPWTGKYSLSLRSALTNDAVHEFLNEATTHRYYNQRQWWWWYYRPVPFQHGKWEKRALAPSHCSDCGLASHRMTMDKSRSSDTVGVFRRPEACEYSCSALSQWIGILLLAYFLVLRITWWLCVTQSGHTKIIAKQNRIQVKIIYKQIGGVIFVITVLPVDVVISSQRDVSPFFATLTVISSK